MTEREYRALKQERGLNVKTIETAGCSCSACGAKDGRLIGVPVVYDGDQLVLCPNCCFLIGQVYERELKPNS